MPKKLEIIVRILHWIEARANTFLNHAYNEAILWHMDVDSGFMSDSLGISTEFGMILMLLLGLGVGAVRECRNLPNQYLSL
ncbi:hypothetical protein BJY01DRAFT_223927 [Aspergillus pseudoustus]|uniref:Uncharacterized protein n=1 Tax=Aspergillus pseudoustus TaxID=1810923 RepID=A0ABR4J442_9EURO